MLLFERPAKPDDFDPRAQDPRAAVLCSIEDGETPVFPDTWSNYKSFFAKIQCGKCGYCESKVLSTGTGHIDHYHPKGSVSELGEDPNTWGEELPGLSNVVGRIPVKVSEQGYWWLAYDWNNFVFVCERCNVGWKRDLFPIAESPRSCPPRQENEETPLLLNPFGVTRPSQHLRFDWSGRVESADQSPIGRETIRTLGLDRESLVQNREDFALSAYQLVREYRQASNEEKKLDALAAIRRLGQAHRPYAGMIRIIFETEAGKPWDWLEARG